MLSVIFSGIGVWQLQHYTYVAVTHCRLNRVSMMAQAAMALAAVVNAPHSA